ncbi:MAG TPA: trypsin-like peptidase domain-containing protein [Holophagaceae bacterium]|jgi:serine protease Do|nr:trypsin-like peptidase domain-containing protein [Holophagaceae bacterium]
MDRHSRPALKHALGLSAFAAACLAGGMALSYHWVASAQEPKAVSVDVKNADSLPPIAQVAQALNPTVVAITNTSFVRARQGMDAMGGNDPFFNFFFGPRQRGPRQGGGEEREISSGSGVVISPDGEILTNNHVIEGAQGSDDKPQIEVKLSDGRTFKGQILGRDKELDIALVKIDADHLPFAKLGDSDKTKVGEWVVAIGNPLGLEHTVTQGIISAKGRRLDAGLGAYLQTDAAINRGNSGGPLLNLKGEVLGINTLIRADGQNIGFAVPISEVTRILKYLRSGQPVSRGYLGIQLTQLNSAFQDALGAKQGAVVSSVERGAPADKAGLQRLDVITGVDGQAVTSPDDLVSAVASRRSGETVKLDILRDGKSRTVAVKLGDRRDMTPQGSPDEEDDGSGQGGAAQQGGQGLNLEKSYGFQVEDLSQANRYQFGIPEGLQGVVVTSVAPRSEAASTLAPGWVVTSVGRAAVANTAQFNEQVKKASGRALLLYIQSPRGDQKVTVAIPPRR